MKYTKEQIVDLLDEISADTSLFYKNAIYDKELSL